MDRPMPEDMAGPAEIISGLVLAGGYSQRMGRDKAALQYHGQAQLRYAYALLQQVCGQSFVSIRAEQRDEALRAALPCIHDHGAVHGPAAGLIAAQQAWPTRSWLLIACDMPLLTLGLLHALCRTAAEDAHADVIGYPAEDGKLEPLCAIWRPSSGPALQTLLSHPQRGLRHILPHLQLRLLPPPGPGQLSNANTPDEARQLQQHLDRQS